MLDRTDHAEELRHLTRTDLLPRVRHQADALLLLAHRRGRKRLPTRWGVALSGFACGAVVSSPKGGSD